MPTTLELPAPPIVDDINRRRMLSGTGLALLLAACGTDEPQTTAAAPSDRSVQHLGGTPSRWTRRWWRPGWFPEHPYLQTITAEADELISLEEAQTSLERLAVAPPDVILAEVWNWKRGLHLVAQALGREPRGEELPGEYQARADQLREALGSSDVGGLVLDLFTHLVDGEQR